MGTDHLVLDRQLCFAVHAASRAFDAAYRQVLRDLDLGLTYPQYLAMMVLWERGPVTVKELGLALRLDSGTLSPLLKRLEAAGHVRRERSAADERSVIVRLTPAGAALRERAQQVPLAIGRATGLTRDGAMALHGMLGELTATLDAYVSRGGPAEDQAGGTGR
ncbi:DNA-binding MarR family transcriptional regulator [Thermocatellispora tengchongensis]|uniref:DNA-binding MarR family transcriptional regulator n=1 Tax=Thermocatellispora tengchongensis TaxID=1073253 RepID=A0A840P604_9ACTN|nr:MarR family transcriptional regulator [Thermocatellispora tengchongensis]MBB5131435.1 DNA-binding MarR family transcriptional regulator [Thermocatellispora tengchongensis]